jgi:MraZ protein
MARFIGEFECKIDSKGRIILPAKLRLQIPDKDAKAMVINRGFEKCLVLYTSTDWNMETEKLAVLNDFNRAARKFIRQFNNGANIVQIDTSSRINIPNALIDYASLSGDIIISCYNHKIEIWDKKHYEEELKFDDEEFSRMAEELMGGNSNNNRSIIGFETDGKDD